MTGTVVLPAARRSPRTWDDVLDWTGSVRALAVLRIAVGLITLVHLRPFLRDAAEGISYTDHFWQPFVAWLPELPDRLWFALIWIGAVAAILLAAGLWTRVAAVAAFAVVAGNLLLSQTHFRHNRLFLIIVLGALALLPCGRVLSVDAWWHRRRGREPWPDAGALWPLWLLRVQVCLVYLSSGISKLVDPDWFSGLVLWDRVVRYQHVLDPTPLPGPAIELLTQRWPYYVIGPAAVLTELFIGFGLLWRRSRIAAVWVALVFHLLIEISASVEVFSYAAIAALAIWVTPSTRDRVVLVGGDRWTRGIVTALVRTGDWFGRFRVEPAAPATPSLSVVDRDGAVRTGGEAIAFVCSRIPLLFGVAAPAHAVITRRRTRRQDLGGA